MKVARLRWDRVLTAASALALAGCMALGGPGGSAPRGPGSAHSATGQALAPQDAMDLLQPGVSTRQAVQDALGPAVVVRFDSGHEVWVYRWPGGDGSPEQATELVLLFPPQGPLAKLRLRSGGAPGTASSPGPAHRAAD